MKLKLSFWPGGIVLLLVGFACGIMTLVVIASSSHTELVSENYYEQEIQYQQRIDGLARAHETGASLSYDQAKTNLVLSFGPRAVVPDAPARVQFYRASAASQDQELPPLPQADGRLAVDISQLQPGPWKVRASWSVGGREYLLESSLTNRGAIPPVH